MLYDSFYQACLFFPLVLSVFLSYRILQCTDLTVEGSFVLGPAVFALFMGTPYATVLGVLAGAVTGVIVGHIQKNNRLNPLLASIIMLFILYGVNLKIMGKPNINLMAYTLDHKSFYGIFAVFIVMMIVFFRSPFVLKLRALGNNQGLMQRLNYNVGFYKNMGLGISNAIAALTGILTAQSNGYVDVSMGQGQALIAIGIVSAAAYLPSRLGLFIVTLLYFLILNFLLFLGMDAIYIKIIMGIMLIIVLRGIR